MALTDEQLIEETLTGNTDAFGELVKQHQGVVVGLAFHLAGNMQDAQDIGQEVFIKAYQHLSKVKQPAKFSSWLRKITENTCKTWLRLNQKKRETLPLAEARVIVSGEQPDDVLLAKELSETVRNAISELSESNRLAVTLFYMDGFSYKEVSEFLGISVGAVKGRLHKARKQLKKGLMTMVEDDFSQTKPKEEFTEKVMRAIAVGRVVTEEGEPVEEAFISVRGGDGEVYEGERGELVHTDADGRYRYPIPSSERGSYRIRAQHDYFHSSPETPFFIEEEGEVDIPDLVLKVPFRRSIRGRVTDEQGKPIEGARLCSFWHGTASATTDADGCYVIDRWTQGYLLFAKAEDYTTAVFNLLELPEYKKSYSLSVDFVLKPAFPTAGRVINENGQPLEEARVSFNYPRQQGGHNAWHTNTDPEGRFCVYGLPEGLMGVHVDYRGYHEIEWQAINTGDTNIELAPSPIVMVKIAGKVVDARTQKPIENFTCYADSPEAPPYRLHELWELYQLHKFLHHEVRADGYKVKSADGFFTMSELPLDAEVDAIVTAKGYVPERMSNVRVTLEREEEPLVFSLEPGRTIRGRVVDAETKKPVANALVRHFGAVRPLMDMLPSGEHYVFALCGYNGCSDNAFLDGQSVATDTNGLFVIDTVGKSGSYLYITNKDRGKGYAPSVIGPIEFDEHEQKRGMTVMLRAGGTIKGTVPELSEGSFWLISKEIPYLGIEHEFALGEDKQFTFEHVMPGKWWVGFRFNPYGSNFMKKAIHLELKDGETISEPFQNSTPSVANEPGVNPEEMSFGTIYADAIVEANLSLRGATMITALTTPDWVRFGGAQFDDWGWCNIDITADTTTPGTHKGEMRFQTDVGELKIPLSVSVINLPAPRKKVLWTPTPFDPYWFKGSPTAPIEELIREYNLDIDFTRRIPPDLEKYQCLALNGYGLNYPSDIWTEDVRRLHNFVEGGGRLIIWADLASGRSVDIANRIVRRYGLEMLNIDSRRAVNINIRPEHLVTDWQRTLLQGVSKLHFFVTSPIISPNPDALLVRYPYDETTAFVAMAKENGEVILIGQSLMPGYIGDEEHRRFFANMLLAEL